MSITFQIVEVGSDEVLFEVQITSNYSKMYHFIGASPLIHDTHGLMARSLVPGLRKSIANAVEASAECKKLIPVQNNWGTYESALECLVALTEALEKHPRGFVRSF